MIFDDPIFYCKNTFNLEIDLLRLSLQDNNLLMINLIQ